MWVRFKVHRHSFNFAINKEEVPAGAKYFHLQCAHCGKLDRAVAFPDQNIYFDKELVAPNYNVFLQRVYKLQPKENVIVNKVEPTMCKDDNVSYSIV